MNTGRLSVPSRQFAGVVIACGFLLSLAAPAAAFDGSRRGFTVEVGAGPSLTGKTDFGYGFATDADGNAIGGSSSELGFAGFTRLRVGWGISGRWTITYVNDVAWRNESFYDGLFTTGLMGIGTTVFHDANAPTWFVEAETGLASVSNLSNSNFNESGFGVQVGGGYEFSRGWLTRMTIGRAWFEDVDDKSTLGLSISKMWY